MTDLARLHGCRSTRLQNWRIPTSRRRASSSTAKPRGCRIYARASAAQRPLARPTSLANGDRATPPSRVSTRCSTQPAARWLRSSALPIAIPVRTVCGNCARRWRWSTVAPNRRRRPSCGCCSYATDYLGPLLKSRSVAAVSTWDGPNARLESSTTASNIGPIPGGTPKTSSDWNSLPGRAGPLFGSAPGNSDTTVPAS